MGWLDRMKPQKLTWRAVEHAAVPLSAGAWVLRNDTGQRALLGALELQVLRAAQPESLFAGYEGKRRSRAVLRRAERPILSSSGHFMTVNVGYDLRRWLPPFFPVLRASDSIFGMTLRAACPEDLIAHLPYAVEHRPEPRTFAEDAVDRALQQIRMTDLVRYAIRSCVFPMTVDREVRLSALARHLITLGTTKSEAFEQRLLLERWSELSEIAASLEKAAATKNAPPRYLQDVARAQETLKSAAIEKQHLIPSDVADIAVAQRLLKSFGELLEHWPAIFEAAQAVNRL